MAHIQLNFFSSSLRKNTDVNIFLPSPEPDDYLFGQLEPFYQKGKKYQTIYLLHGSYDDCHSWVRKSSLERYAQERKVAVVMPTAENSMYQNMKYGEDYETFIAKELPEFLHITLPLSREREDTFIAGLSMGGGGAFSLAMKYPDKYAAAASLSGGLDMKSLKSEAHLEKMPVSYRNAVGNHEAAIDLIDNVDVKKLPKMLMTCGTEDFILPCNRSFYKKAKEYGLDIVYKESPGAHTWEFWDQSIKEVLDWLPLLQGMV